MRRSHKSFIAYLSVFNTVFVKRRKRLDKMFIWLNLAIMEREISLFEHQFKNIEGLIPLKKFTAQ